MSSTRTALYYPEMIITNKKWIRQALLYWDDIGSIIPEAVWNEHPYFERENDEMNLLYKEKLYRPFFPETFSREYGQKLKNQIHEEFFNRLDHFRSTRAYGIQKSRLVFQSRQMYPDLFQELSNLGLVTRNVSGQAGPISSKQPSYFMEENTRKIYISLLAEYLARYDSKLTIPSTDEIDYLNFAYESEGEKNSQICSKILFDNLLPVPSENMPLDKIIDFRQDHYADLLKLRKSLDEFESGINVISDKRDLKEISNKFQEKIELDIRYLDETLRDRKIETFFGSFETINSAKHPEWWPIILGSGLVAAGTGAFVVCAITGIALGAAIHVGKYLAKRNIERNQILRESPYSYVYHLKKFRA